MGEAALLQAQQKCIPDVDVRALRQECDTACREVINLEHLLRFADLLLQLFADCPS